MIGEVGLGIGGGMFAVGLPLAAWIWKNTGKNNGMPKDLTDKVVFKDLCDERSENITSAVNEVKDKVEAVDLKVGTISEALVRVETIVTRNGGSK